MTVQAAPQDYWCQEREGFSPGEAWRMHLFDLVRDDLKHVQEVDFRGSDQYRIARTMEQLNALQGKMAAHQYEQPQLDEVIGSLLVALA